MTDEYIDSAIRFVSNNGKLYVRKSHYRFAYYTFDEVKHEEKNFDKLKMPWYFKE